MTLASYLRTLPTHARNHSVLRVGRSTVLSWTTDSTYVRIPSAFHLNEMLNLAKIEPGSDKWCLAWQLLAQATAPDQIATSPAEAA